MPKGNATIYDIAKALDLSPATVSLALNDDARINIKTKERVRAAAQAMHYRLAKGGRSVYYAHIYRRTGCATPGLSG